MQVGEGVKIIINKDWQGLETELNAFILQKQRAGNNHIEVLPMTIANYCAVLVTWK